MDVLVHTGQILSIARNNARPPVHCRIRMWSLGCILVETYIGTPLFLGSDRLHSMQNNVKILGMIPCQMLDRANDHTTRQFVDAVNSSSGGSAWKLKQTNRTAAKEATSTQSQQKVYDQRNQLISPSADPMASLRAILQSGQRRKTPPVETDHLSQKYKLFVDLVHKMLAYE